MKPAAAKDAAIAQAGRMDPVSSTLDVSHTKVKKIRLSHHCVQASRPVGAEEDLPSRAARNLMDASILVASASANADITVVSNALEFQAAVMSGSQDIELRAHVDLTDMALALNTDVSLPATVLGEIKPSTRSIRVRTRELIHCAVFQRSSVKILAIAGFVGANAVPHPWVPRPGVN